MVMALLATFSVLLNHGAVASAAETLTAPADLPSGADLVSPNGEHFLRMQTDGNLVLITAGAPRWNTGTDGNPGARLAMQADGNLVIYSTTNQALWTPMTSGSNHRLVVQDDGNVVMYNPANQVAWQSGTRVVPSTLTGGQTMNPGDVLQSPSGEHRLVMQTDGNLVLYRGQTARWQSVTSGSGHRLVMQTDGNLVMYNPANAVAWHTNTRASNANPRLVVQDDGNVVVLHNNTAAWNTGTRTGAETTWTKPAIGPFTSGYGMRNGSMHNGVDIAPSCGQPIYAASGGTVTRAGRANGYGNLIVIDHGGGIVTRYAHMYDAGILVGVGNVVSSGQRIGTIGSFGDSTGCHLHFEVQLNGGFTDPEPFMRNRGVALR
jgi:murein DD-endopeptidase MepM/ murein hydrolase activator NlpD